MNFESIDEADAWMSNLIDTGKAHLRINMGLPHTCLGDPNVGDFNTVRDNMNKLAIETGVTINRMSVSNSISDGWWGRKVSFVLNISIPFVVGHTHGKKPAKSGNITTSRKLVRFFLLGKMNEVESSAMFSGTGAV
tara:strand:- start:2199 stop:2606 length:408 start_codon:yes stop_codon:yes gene_type:complete